MAAQQKMMMDKLNSERLRAQQEQIRLQQQHAHVSLPYQRQNSRIFQHFFTLYSSPSFSSITTIFYQIFFQFGF